LLQTCDPASTWARHGTAPLKRNALTLGATVSGQFTSSVSGYLDANYEYRAAGQDAHRVTAGWVSF
jgi:hypothetical protein